jgi:hypothetical protein
METKSSARFSFIKLAVAIAVLTLASAGVARADSITFDNQGGSVGSTVTGGVPGPFVLSDSDVTSITGATLSGKTLLSFTTGSWISSSGSLATGGQWNPGGTVTITEAGLGVIFKGTFSTNVTWTLNSATNCTVCQYSLSGGITGTYWADGEPSNGTGGVTVLNASTVQLTITTTGGLYSGGKGTKFLSDKGGSTNIVTPTGLTAEPGSLILMGTGLLGAGFVARKKIRNQVV